MEGKKKPSKRGDERKFKRAPLRYGTDKAEHAGMGIRLSTTGVFITANRPIFKKGTRIVVEFKTSAGPITVSAIVRHCRNIAPQLSSPGQNGMGVEFIDPPPELVEYLAGL
jgi:hypothetical protein